VTNKTLIIDYPEDFSGIRFSTNEGTYDSEIYDAEKLSALIEHLMSFLLKKQYKLECNQLQTIILNPTDSIESGHTLRCYVEPK